MYFYIIVMLVTLDLNELYEACHVKFPKNYYIVRFKSRLMVILVTLDLNELYEACHVKFPKNYYIVRFKSRLIVHAGGGVRFSVLEC